MSILGDILGKVFGPSAAQAAEAAPAAPSASSAAVSPAAPAPAATKIDVGAVLDAMNEKIPEELDWRSSIVDLMKVLGLDSSLAARQKLAQELHYTGDLHDSAAMNIWLHAQVLAKFAANGGHW